MNLPSTPLTDFQIFQLSSLEYADRKASEQDAHASHGGAAVTAAAALARLVRIIRIVGIVRVVGVIRIIGIVRINRSIFVDYDFAVFDILDSGQIRNPKLHGVRLGSGGRHDRADACAQVEAAQIPRRDLRAAGIIHSDLEAAVIQHKLDRVHARCLRIFRPGHVDGSGGFNQNRVALCVKDLIGLIQSRIDLVGLIVLIVGEQTVDQRIAAERIVEMQLYLACSRRIQAAVIVAGDRLKVNLEGRAVLKVDRLHERVGEIALDDGVPAVRLERSVSVLLAAAISNEST